MYVRPINVTYLNLSVMYSIIITQIITQDWYESNDYIFKANTLNLSPDQITILGANLYVIRCFVSSSLTLLMGILFDIIGRRKLILLALVLYTVYGVAFLFVNQVWEFYVIYLF